MNSQGLMKWLLPVLAVSVSMACSHHEHHETVMDRIEHHSIDQVADSAAEAASEHWVEIEHHDGTFYTHSRKPNMKRFDCRECHVSSMKAMKSSTDQRAHWDVKVHHANDDIMDCATCHGHGDASELVSLNGVAIDFDFSHQLCGQCHSNQLKDWYGGAHGKKVNGWKQPRVSKTCVECHDPHEPGFEPRMPARYNTQKVEERK